MELAILDSLAGWLKATSLSKLIVSSPWLWPGAETVHFIGLALLIGSVGLFDLRILGMAKRLPVRPLHGFLFWGIVGFALDLLTGTIFFVGEPGQYVHNYVFWLKLLFIFLAGLNAVLFYVTGVARDAEAVGPGEDAPASAKVIAATSLALWIGVMYLGRMLPFLGEAF